MKDLELNSVTLTGLKGPCVWHDLPNFHIAENLSVDIMHDVFEGVGSYDKSNYSRIYN